MNGFWLMIVGVVVGLIGWCSAFVGGEMLDAGYGFKKTAPWAMVTFSGVVLALAAICMVIVGAIRFFQYLWTVTA